MDICQYNLISGVFKTHTAKSAHRRAAKIKFKLIANISILHKQDNNQFDSNWNMTTPCSPYLQKYINLTQILSQLHSGSLSEHWFGCCYRMVESFAAGKDSCRIDCYYAGFLLWDSSRHRWESRQQEPPIFTYSTPLYLFKSWVPICLLADYTNLFGLKNPSD